MEPYFLPDLYCYLFQEEQDWFRRAVTVCLKHYYLL